MRPRPSGNDLGGARTFPATEEPARAKYYVLEMFPYPSGRIHMGHVRNYTLGDVVARYKRAQGFNVLHPMGWDAFGLPAENAAMERGVHPARLDLRRTSPPCATQLKRMGLSYRLDAARSRPAIPTITGMSRRCSSTSCGRAWPIARESWVNWDPVEQTVLANEQVIDGRGWRSGALVEKRKLSQWFLSITDYADELLDGAEDAGPLAREGAADAGELDRPVGRRCACASRSTGVASESARGLHHPARHAVRRVLLRDLARPSAGRGTGARTIRRWPTSSPSAAACGTSEAAIETAEKRGYDTGLTAVHPFDRRLAALPVYVANFVLMDYGTGAIFGCPAHDQRDLDFARKYGLPVTPVVLPPGADPATFAVGDEAYTGAGALVNSRFLDGLGRRSRQGRGDRPSWRAQGAGDGTTVYRLRDWGVSRQRYWGCPIPVIHCAACGIVPVPENDLPVTPARGCDLRPARQSAGASPDLEARRLPDLRRRGRARDRHLRHLLRSLLVFRPLLLARTRRDAPFDPRGGATTGCRSTSISAASSMRCCTCSMPASSPAR